MLKNYYTKSSKNHSSITTGTTIKIKNKTHWNKLIGNFVLFWFVQNKVLHREKLCYDSDSIRKEKSS